MREIKSEIIRDTVASLCIDANKNLPADVVRALEKTYREEKDALPKGIAEDMLSNLKAAKELDIPICQDTGMAVIFAEIGQDAHITGGAFEAAINAGVAKGYTEGFLRCSIVKDPLQRVNTEDNTPAVIHTRLVSGDKIKLTVAPKGFGSENMSRIIMLKPSATRADIINFVLETVKTAGGNPCPPIIIGVGIGGNFESCAYLSKKALMKPIDEINPSGFYAQLEEEILAEVNKLNIGPQGFGGRTTALGVNIEAAATHIAGLPLAVNISCHVTRHATAVI